MDRSRPGYAKFLATRDRVRGRLAGREPEKAEAPVSTPKRPTHSFERALMSDLATKKGQQWFAINLCECGYFTIIDITTERGDEIIMPYRTPPTEDTGCTE